ncbi:Tetratricopeptide-like helical domain superfamily [Arabidopsis suecica]|uniref:Tetratricopeptide-like helical domain superfamily n=1 Tax=Arabidopsis suecica TaxID=45249 RepID=A0A8T1ZX09_ARASU|nr:Tetratricopeptide-like helical domain superfamily [Arabidopsis suecica]
MEVKVATTTSFHWSGRHTAIPQCPSFSQTLTSSKRRRSRTGDVSVGGSLRLKPSTFLGTQSGKLHRSKSCELWEFSNSTTKKIRTDVKKKHNPLRRVCSASSGFFSDEAFSVKMKELASQFRNSGEESEEENKHKSEAVDNDNDIRNHRFGSMKLLQESVPGLASLEAPWAEMVNHSSIERKANSVDLPLSLRIIKRKLQEEALKEASATTYCSINRAFSSMVFMIEELHSFALQTRVGVLKQVKKEMHASLLWIFQRVFSQTPTLMVYVMILLANYTVHSVASNLAIAAAPPHSDVTKEAAAVTKGLDRIQQRIDLGPLVSGRDGKELDGSKWLGSMNFDKVSHLPTHRDSVSGEGMREEEVSLWNSMVEEADQMQDSTVDREMRLRLVSPITARIEVDDYANYTRTELLYKIGLAQEPNNHLLLANYAQFLYLVTQDHERAENCFKKAIESEDVDAEAYSKYAIFLWKVRNDLWAAEENFLEAISADPTNSYYAANYANFLWQTGGEETCFPLEDSPQEMV